MRKGITALVVMMTMGAPALAWQGTVSIETPNTQMVVHAEEGEDLRMAYYGDKVADINQLKDAGDDLNFAALPAFGTVDMIHMPALQVQHANGD